MRRAAALPSASKSVCSHHDSNPEYVINSLFVRDFFCLYQR